MIKTPWSAKEFFKGKISARKGYNPKKCPISNVQYPMSNHDRAQLDIGRWKLDISRFSTIHTSPSKPHSHNS